MPPPSVPSDLAELQALLDSLAEDQSRVENAVLRVRTTNRDEKEATTRFVAQERLAALRKKGDAPGPGAYNSHSINQHVHGRRATGGLIHPLPKHALQRRKKRAEAEQEEEDERRRRRRRRAGARRGVGGSSVPSRANLDLVRPRVISGAAFRAPKDKVLDAVAKAEALRREGGEPRPEDLPSAMAVLSRACAPAAAATPGGGGRGRGRGSGSGSGGGNADRLVFISAHDGRMLKLSKHRASSSTGAAQYSVVLSDETKSRKDPTRGVVALVPVGSAVVFRFLGKYDVFGKASALVGQRPAANGRGSLFAAEIPAVPAPGKPILVVLRNVETGKYVARANVDSDSGEIGLGGGIAQVGCFSNERSYAERFRVFAHSPEPGAYDTVHSLQATRKNTPGFGFGSAATTPRRGGSRASTPTTEARAANLKKSPTPSSSALGSAALDGKTVRGASFGKSKSKRGMDTGGPGLAGLLEDEDLLRWLKSGRRRRVMLGLPRVDGGVVLTAPTNEGTAVHARDRWPGTGHAVLTFRYIPSPSDRYNQSSDEDNTDNNTKSLKKTPSAEFAIMTERGMYLRVREQDGAVCVSKKDASAAADEDDSIAFKVAVHGKFVSIVSCAGAPEQPQKRRLCVSDKNSGRVLQVARGEDIQPTELRSETLFRVYTNVQGGGSLGNPDADGFAVIKPRTRGGAWRTPSRSSNASSASITPVTPSNTRVPSEGAPTPMASSWMDDDDGADENDMDDFDSDQMDFDDSDLSDGGTMEDEDQPPVEMPDLDVDRLLRPRVAGTAWVAPSAPSDAGARARKRKLRSANLTPGPGRYDMERAMKKIQKRANAGGAVAFGRTNTATTATASSVVEPAAVRRRRAQRVREQAALGPGTYDTSVARGSSAIAVDEANSATAKKGAFARSDRFASSTTNRKKKKSKLLAQNKAVNMSGDDDALSVDNEPLANDMTGVNSGRDEMYNELLSDLKMMHSSRDQDRYSESVRYSNSFEPSSGSREDEFRDGWSDRDRPGSWQTDEGKRGGREERGEGQALYSVDEGKRGNREDIDEGKRSSPNRSGTSPNKNARKSSTRTIQQQQQQQQQRQQRHRHLPAGVDLEDLLEEDGAASAMMAAPDLNISAVKPRVKGTTWGHKSVAKNWKNYHALRRAKRRKQREKEIGPTHYDADSARKALVDPRVVGGPNFKKEESSRKQSKKISRRARTKQAVDERRRLRKLVSKNPALKGLEPGAILESQMHEDWTQKWAQSNKPVFEYREPEPLGSPARRAKAAREREKQGPARWLSTQLPDDWVGGGGGGGGGDGGETEPGASRFDRQLGRDRVRVKGAGRVVRERFDAPARVGLDPLGPGHYEDAVRQADSIDPLARIADRGIMSWDKRPGRKDSVGPFGERPEAIVEMDEEAGELEGQILDLRDANLERPNRKNAQVFTWRTGDKWDDAGDAEGGGADGMYDEDEQRLLLSPKDHFSRPRQKNGIRFDQQIGRRDDGPASDGDNDGMDMGWDEGELQLDPRLTPVEKRKDVGHAFSNRPRFEEPKGRRGGGGGGDDGDNEFGYDEGEELLLSPKEDFFRPKTHFGVDMSKQASRGLASPVADDTDDDFADHHAYKNAEYDVETALDRLKGGRLGAGERSGVSFAKQKPRFEGVVDADSDHYGTGHEGRELLLSPKEYDSRKKRSQPAHDWGRAKPRFSPLPADEAEYMGSEYVVDNEPALELDPRDDGLSNRTGGGGGKGGVAMHKSKPRWSPPPDRSGHAADAAEEGATLLLDPGMSESTMRRKGRISPAGWAKQRGRVDEVSSAHTDTSHLVYDDADPDFGKRGGGGASRKTNTNGKGSRQKDAWAKQKGRSPKPTEKDMEALGLGVERLILSPDDAAVKGNRTKGSFTMGSTTGRGGAAGSGGSRRGSSGVDGGPSVYQDGDIVKVDVHEFEDKRKRHVGGVQMGATMTVPRKASLGKPPRPPKGDKKSHTLTGIKRAKMKIKKKKKMTPAQRLLRIARQQHLQTEEGLVQDALKAWE